MAITKASITKATSISAFPKELRSSADQIMKKATGEFIAHITVFTSRQTGIFAVFLHEMLLKLGRL